MRPIPPVALVLLSLTLLLPASATASATERREPGGAAAASSMLAPTAEIALRWTIDDAPVARGEISRSWTWGPQIFRSSAEPYHEAPSGVRNVWYLDKARMEITRPDANRTAPWYVTSGLLVRELIGGLIQVGDDAEVPAIPADVPVAGDLDAPLATTITYLDLRPLASLSNDNRAPARIEYGVAVAERLGKSGVVSQDAALLQYDVQLGSYDDVLGHNIPAVFTDALPADQLLYIAGRPLTEPYWTIVPVNGTPTDVLVQAFERRVLTYTPSNPPSWRVEWGNVGRQYAQWRYGSAEDGTPLDPGAALNTRPPIDELAQLTPEGARIAAERDGNVGVAVLDMQAGQLYSIGGTRSFPMFSTAKVPIMLGVLEDVRRDGRAIAAWEDQALRSMIQLSNNEAATALLESIGGAPALQRYLRAIDIDSTVIDRELWGYSTTTPQDMARLMAKLGDCTILTEELCRYALELMRGVTPGQAWGVSAGVPPSASVALKNGWLPDADGWALNSIGYVAGPDKRYAIAVYTRTNPARQYGIDTIEAISARIYPAVP